MFFNPQQRLGRERHTIRIMIRIFCKGQHRPADGLLCAECQGLSVYAMQRIDRCQFQDDKPTCAKCPVHCYKPAMREQVRKVMRYAGPRMMVYHPLLALFHYVDEFAKARRTRLGARRFI
ncbi:MAG: nitrous oxide-stimulated promoter family protein [Verrucomicrobiota bacterium]